jgi:integrase
MSTVSQDSTRPARQHARGEGSIYLLKDGRYAIAVPLGIIDGRRVRVTKYAATEREAKKMLRSLLVDRDKGKLKPTAKAEISTVGQWLSHWFLTMVKPTGRANKVRGYGYIINSVLIPAFGKVKLDEFNADHVRVFLATRLANKAFSTVKHERAVLHAAMGRAAEIGKISSNVVSVAKLGEAPKRCEPKHFSKGQVAIALTAADGTRFFPYWRVMFLTGMRPAEALALRWSDVDWESGTFTVRRDLVRPQGGGFLFEPTKTVESERSYSLRLPGLFDALKSQQALQAQDRLLAGSTWKDHGLVFAAQNGNPIQMKVLRSAWTEMLSAASLPQYDMYATRATAGTMVYEATGDIEITARFLGHSETRTTKRYYAATTDKMRERDTEKLMAALA